MFYSEFILTKKGPLAKIWLAAHWERKLSKAQISQTNVVRSVEDIVNPMEPLALRLSSQLLLGVVKIYSRQARYLLEDCSEILNRIKLMFQWNNGNELMNFGLNDLPQTLTTAQLNAITLPDQTELDWNLYLSLTDPKLYSNDDLSSLSRSESMNLPERARRQSMSFGNDALPMDMFLDEGFGVADDDEMKVYKDLEKSLGSMNQAKDMSIEMARDVQPERFLSSDFLGMDVSPNGSFLVDQQDNSRKIIEDGDSIHLQDLPMEFNLNEDHLNVSAELFDVGFTSFREGFSAKKKLQTHRPRVTKRPRLIDERTELAPSVIQKQLKDTSDIILNVSWNIFEIYEDSCVCKRKCFNLINNLG